jgi:hypothetical protein
VSLKYLTHFSIFAEDSILSDFVCDTCFDYFVNVAFRSSVHSPAASEILSNSPGNEMTAAGV